MRIARPQMGVTMTEQEKPKPRKKKAVVAEIVPEPESTPVPAVKELQPLPAEKKPARARVKDVVEKPLERVRVRARTAVEKAADVARDVAEAASETAKEVAELAGETARSALQATSMGAQIVAQLAEDSAKVAVQLAGDTARAAGQVAQEVALQMAQTYLRKTSLTLDLSETLLNKQVRQMVQGHDYVDYITVRCGDDRLNVSVDGHYKRLIYTVTLGFDVLECKISRGTRFMRVRQVKEDLDMQVRQGNLLTNFAARRAASGVFTAANRLPTYAPVRQLLEEMPGMHQEAPRLWYLDLNQNRLMELLQNRSWMVERLLSLSDLGTLPGLSTLKDSQDMLMQLVNQFEIRDLRVRPGKVEMLVGISS